MTYSIIAQDHATGQFGVAVQTFNFGVGAWVPWAMGGVGVVATQALTERKFGTSGLALMQGGHSAQATLDALLAIDPKREYRQVAMLDSHGNVAIHTGASCFPEAGSVQGDRFSVQGNMLLSATTWDAMALAYQTADGDFAERLLMALEAAQDAGGDMRGRQTAALLIVDAVSNPIPLIDIRVDHHPQPLIELRRLLQLHRAYNAEYQLAEMTSSSSTTQVDSLIQILIQSGEPYLLYLGALHLAGKFQREAEAVEMLQNLINESRIWYTYLQREAAVDNFGIPGLGAKLLTTLKEPKT